MPGYRFLSTSVTGAAADHARQAEELRREGDPETAVSLLEEALAASRSQNGEMPGWLCGRLAALYRSLGRYDDEVELLERYRESQTSEEARTRYDARLSKARTIAERKRPRNSGAVESVRKVLGKPRRGAPSAPFASSVSSTVQAALGEAFAADTDHEARLDAVVRRLAAESLAAKVPLERVVDALRAASLHATALSESTRAERYRSALLKLLPSVLEEPPSAK